MKNRLKLLIVLLVPCVLQACTHVSKSPANRLAYLDEVNPFHPHQDFPKLVTPQWVGEKGVEAVVTLGIDDMRGPEKYESFLRPILERLKEIDGRAPVSILTNSFKPDHPQAQTWLKEGLTIEVHTLTHPCPLLHQGSFRRATETVHGGLDLLAGIPGNKPVAYRMPCCDSMNSLSPRFFAEIFNKTSPAGRYLQIDSSVFNITNSKDKSLPPSLVVDADGNERFAKYLSKMKSYVGTIENYPYPYVIDRLCWEFPCVVPSDWEAQNLIGNQKPQMLEDWQRALDVTVLKQGVMNLCFHPHGWSSSEQFVSFIDYAVKKYGKKVKFLTFGECLDRLNQNLLKGNPLRNNQGSDNGVRILDVDDDGFMDVLIGNGTTKVTRVWQPKKRSWSETKLPFSLASGEGKDAKDASVLLGVLDEDGRATAIAKDTPDADTGKKSHSARAWKFDGKQWRPNKNRNPDGLAKADSILRDVNGNKICELITGNKVFEWQEQEGAWKELSHGLPDGISYGEGVRFIDLNKDGVDDLVFSDPERWGVYLWTKKPNPGLGWKPGWGYTVRKGKRGDKDAIPMISRGGEHPNNGAWFHSDHLWVQNEDTANLPNVVDRRSFKKLLAFDVPEARTPEESLQCLKTREGFVVELVAAEPLVLDPVAFDWGADGKLWVAEMGDYPLGIDGKGKSGGVVRFLEDRNDDGRYDHSTVFLSELNFPNGVMPWGKGVLVSTPPDILYAEDTNGDGKADLRKVLFTGFREGNQQHRMNGFVLGLDNWIYAANGDSGGMIKSTDTGKVVNINGRDFRFKVTGEMQTLSNQTQFGLHRDDWGNWFGNNNPHWIWHVHLPMHYVVRNPHLVAKDTGKMLFNYPDSRRCFPISPQMERPNSPKSYGTVTSANSPSPYRGGLFGPDFERSVFISEPVHNLVHREVLEPDGVTFTSHRAKGEEKSEFLASSDNWFRPTMTKTGPDGALYVADMYRLVIEHPQWIPPTMQSRVNLREGSNRGRIWRVFPKGAKLRKTPRLEQMTTKELVGALDSPNGWQRDTIQRLLLTRDDKSVSSSLRKLAQASKNPKVRLQTLCILEGLDGLDSKVLKQALEDPHPSVRKHAVRVCEGNHAELIASRIEDESIRVRRQVGFSLGEWKDPKAAEALVRLALADADNPRVQLAVKSSSLPHAATMLKQIFADQAKAPTSLISDLIRFAILDDNLGPLAKVFNEIAADKNLQRQFTLMAGFVDAIEQRKETLDQFHQRLTKNSKQGIKGLETVFSKVRATAQDGEAEEGSRVSAIALLGRGPTKRQEDINLLSELLAAGNRPSIRKAALSTLPKLHHAATAVSLLARWNSYAPTDRVSVTDHLLSRDEYASALLDAIERDKLPAVQISPAHRQKLLKYPRPPIMNRAKKLLGGVNRNRAKVIQRYAGVGDLKGNAEHGKLLFTTHCSVCHSFKGQGNKVGPDLAAFSVKPINDWLIGILDPNRAVETTYTTYLIMNKDDSALTGVLASETPAALIIRTASGQEMTVLRKNLKSVQAIGQSLMPEGLETAMKPEAVADLLAYLRKP